MFHVKHPANPFWRQDTDRPVMDASGASHFGRARPGRRGVPYSILSYPIGPPTGGLFRWPQPGPDPRTPRSPDQGAAQAQATARA
jgi:hypothetical protein